MIALLICEPLLVASHRPAQSPGAGVAAPEVKRTGTPARNVSVTFWTNVGARPPTCTPSVLKWIGCAVEIVRLSKIFEFSTTRISLACTVALLKTVLDGIEPSAIADIAIAESVPF